MKRQLFFAAALLSFTSFSAALAQNTPNLRLLKSVDPAPAVGNPIRYSEVTGCGSLAAIAGWGFNGSARNAYLYDVSIPTSPQLLAVAPSDGSVYDLQIHGRYLYLAAQNQGYIDVFDIINPSAPVRMNRFQPNNPAISPHTFWVSGKELYIADNFAPGITVLDITDKKNFVRKGVINNGFGRSHDNTVIRGKLYAAFIFTPAGLWLADVKNAASPKNLATVLYPGAGTHNAWPTEDERYVLTTDEVGQTAHNIKIWDAQPAGGLNLVATYETRPGATVHNVYVRGRYAYMSYYCDGIRIIDINDPTKPVEVAAYDLDGAAPCGGFASTWGMYPYSKYIYASDMSLGLHIFEFDQHPPANLTGNVRDAVTGAAIAGAYVYFPEEYATTRSEASGGYEIPWFKDGEVRVAAEALGYLADTLVTTISAHATTQLDFFLRKAGTVAEENEQPANLPPQDFYLLPSYPNPFPVERLSGTNGTLQIAYRLPAQAAVRVDITNMLGQRVMSLVDRVANAGEHTVAWNGKDERGRTVSAGVYFINLYSGGRVLQQKLTLVK